MKHKISLRTLLILLVLAAVAPGAAVVVYSSVVVQRDEAIKAQEDLEAVAKLVAATQEQWIEGVRQILNTVASGPSVRRDDLRELCSEFLRNVKSASPSYTNIGIVDVIGNMQCQALKSTAPLDVSQRRYFTKTIGTQQFTIGDYIVGFATGRKVMGFGMPVYSYAGALSGVAFASVDLEYANQQLQQIALPKSMHIVVTDAAGIVLLSNEQRGTQIGQQLPEPVLRQAILRHQGAQSLTTQTQNEIWLHALRPLGGADGNGLSVAVSIRKADAVGLADGHFKLQLGIIAAASLVGFLLAWLLAQRSVARPVFRLLERMQRVERSQSIEADIAIPPPKNIELVEFAEIDSRFSSMLKALQTNRQQLIEAQQITRVGFYQLDLITSTYSASPIAYEILGLDPSLGSISVAQYEALLHPDDRATVKLHRDQLFQGGQPLRLQYRVIRPDGEVRWIDGFGFVDKAADGTPLLYSGAIQDVTERMQSEQAARNNERQYQLLFENSLDGVLQTAPDGTILAANPAACEIFRMSEQALREVGRQGVVALDDPRLSVLLAERAATGRASGQLTMLRADGSRFEAELTTSIYTNATGNIVSSIVMRDISARIQSEQHIHRLAFFDALTDLPNRRMLMDRLAMLVASSQRSGQVGAVLFIDLDHFKNVNDARGHATGDVLLRLVAQRLLDLMRAEDTVARIGGDEFVVLLPGLSQEFTSAAQHAMAVADKLREALTLPFFIDNQQYASGGSIGVTLLPKVGQTADDLLREADTAMYRAKNGGRNRIAFFEATMQFEVESRLALANDLAQAIGTDQLEMFLQPQFDAQGQPSGGEMLMRWTHPQLGAISPINFIPVAEESGLILPLGDWVLREGCRAFLRLEAAGRPMSISVNVSPRQFHQADFVARVKTVLRDTGAPASGLIFEVTEGLLIDNIDDTIQRMGELVALGIRFSIDDFGTGYSSLGYLRRLPLYELKIDRSFVQDTPTDAGPTAIVQSILSMASHLGLQVVAEGVETEEQAAFLRAAGCTSLQGYLLARPMRLDKWLEIEPVTN